MDELTQTESTPCSGTDPEANTLIVNELLTFVSDKINTMPYDMYGQPFSHLIIIY